jgi:hypothetical protein
VTAIARVDPRAEEALLQAPPPVSMILNPVGEPCSERLVGEEGIVSFAVDQRPQRPVRLVGDPLEGPGAHDDPDAAGHTDASA